MTDDINNKRMNHINEEIAGEIFMSEGIPTPREAKSQKSQIDSSQKRNLRKDKKVKMKNKLI